MIHVVYFTCAGHFDELMVSLKSVRTVGLPSGLIGRVYIYCDLNDYFTESQERALGYGLIIRKTADSMSWGGTKTVENELMGFNEIRKEVAPNDLIMNFDSDAILISTEVLRAASETGPDTHIVGHLISHHFMASWDHSLKSETVTFFQGSCYFLRACFVRDMLLFYGTHRAAIVDGIKKMCFVADDVIPPDVTMSVIAKNAGGNGKFLQCIVGRNMSVVHLELTKDDRWCGFGKFVGIANPGRHDINPLQP